MYLLKGPRFSQEQVIVWELSFPNSLLRLVAVQGPRCLDRSLHPLHRRLQRGVVQKTSPLFHLNSRSTRVSPQLVFRSGWLMGLG